MGPAWGGAIFSWIASITKTDVIKPAQVRKSDPRSLKKRDCRICAVIFPKCPERFDIKGEERKFSSTEDRQNEVIRTVFPLRYRKSFCCISPHGVTVLKSPGRTWLVTGEMMLGERTWWNNAFSSALLPLSKAVNSVTVCCSFGDGAAVN